MMALNASGQKSASLILLLNYSDWTCSFDAFCEVTEEANWTQRVFSVCVSSQFLKTFDLPVVASHPCNFCTCEHSQIYSQLCKKPLATFFKKLRSTRRYLRVLVIPFASVLRNWPLEAPFCDNFLNSLPPEQSPLFSDATQTLGKRNNAVHADPFSCPSLPFLAKDSCGFRVGKEGHTSKI